MHPIVSIDGLTKRYGTFIAVDSVSMQVKPADIVALLGPNGAGKTTIIKMLMGILCPTSGTARIAGLDCFTDRAEVKRHVGYLPDDPIFYDFLRGREVLRFVGEMHGLNPRETAIRANGLLERLELQDALDEFAVNYSMGMKKKLALVCAMLHSPELLILDEPTNGLDPIATRSFIEVVRDEAARGTAIFYSTHLLDQAERLCQRVAILKKARLVSEGTIEELRSSLAPGGSLEDVFFQVASDQQDPPSPNSLDTLPREDTEASPTGNPH